MTENKKPSGASNDVASPPSRQSRTEALLNEGEVLSGGFVVGEIAGEGGMATVYKALQKSLNRTVAIKVLHSRFVRDPEFVSRFEAEAGALASLQHPNIVNIIDRGHDSGRYFFVMEYVEGETLDKKIVEDRLSFPEWRAVVTACEESLDYVHKRGVVHRDIKPSNILIDKQGHVKISDFGIAHILGGDEGEAAQITAPARAVGTANYMAPEQTADPSNVDHRADIYSLGVTFYKMLTRMLPVGAFPSPSEANHNVPVAVDEVIFKSMCPDRDDRYQTVREFCDDLSKALKEQTVSITSVLDYRNARTGSALYTGKDFLTPPPAARAQAAQKDKEKEKPKEKKKEEKKQRQKQDSSVEIKKSKASSKQVKKPAGTPAPVKRKSGEKKTPAPAEESSSGWKMIALAAGGLAIILLVVVIYLVTSTNEAPRTELRPGEIPEAVSEERERKIREILESRKDQEDQVQTPEVQPPSEVVPDEIPTPAEEDSPTGS
ncbi:serine/threonine protein kinase [bacterium]|nr:serine/threonine protein kinase [bacterium]